MMCIWWNILLFVLLGFLAYIGAALWISTAALATFLFLITNFSNLPLAWILPAWILLAIIAVPLNVSFLRRKLASDHIFSIFRKIMPSMSATEREALEAGTVWWDKELFSGRPNWRKMRSFPKPKLTSEEQAFLDGPVEELCRIRIRA